MKERGEGRGIIMKEGKYDGGEGRRERVEGKGRAEEIGINKN